MSETLYKLWRGEIPLRRTYWLYWFCVAFVLGFSRGFLEGYYPWLAEFDGPGCPGGGTVAFYVIVELGLRAWSAFMVVPLWRSASRYEGRRLWAVLAKIVAISNAIGVALFAYGFWVGFSGAIAGPVGVEA